MLKQNINPCFKQKPKKDIFLSFLFCRGEVPHPMAWDSLGNESWEWISYVKRHKISSPISNVCTLRITALLVLGSQFACPFSFWCPRSLYLIWCGAAEYIRDPLPPKTWAPSEASRDASRSPLLVLFQKRIPAKLSSSSAGGGAWSLFPRREIGS